MALFTDQHVIVFGPDDAEDSIGIFDDETDARARQLRGYLAVVDSEPLRVVADYRDEAVACRFWQDGTGAVLSAFASTAPDWRAEWLRHYAEDAARFGWVRTWTNVVGLLSLSDQIDRFDTDTHALLTDAIVLIRKRREIIGQAAADRWAPAPHAPVLAMVLDGERIASRPGNLPLIAELAQTARAAGVAVGLAVPDASLRYLGTEVLRAALQWTVDQPGSAGAGE